MKKLLLLLAFVATLSFVSCTKAVPNILEGSQWTSEFKSTEEGVTGKFKVVAEFRAANNLILTAYLYQGGQIVETTSEVIPYVYYFGTENEVDGTGIMTFEEEPGTPSVVLDFKIAGNKLTLLDPDQEEFPHNIVFKRDF